MQDQATASPTVPGCLSCAHLHDPDAPPCDRIVVSEGWTVAHAIGANLEGWLVVVPNRHVVAIDELTAQEASALGMLLAAVTAALRDVVGCERTYVVSMGEMPGFAHLHFHVVPRHTDMPEAYRGVRVFRLLANPELDAVAPEVMDVLALRLRAHLDAAGVGA